MGGDGQWVITSNNGGDHGGMVPIRCDQIMAPPSRVIWRLSISGSAASPNDKITYKANAALVLGHHVKIVKRSSLLCRN